MPGALARAPGAGGSGGSWAGRVVAGRRALGAPGVPRRGLGGRRSMRTARGRLGAGGGEPRGRPALSWALTMAMRVVRVSCRHTMGARGCWGRGSVRVNRVRVGGQSRASCGPQGCDQGEDACQLGLKGLLGRECATLAVPLLFGDERAAQVTSMCVPCTAGQATTAPGACTLPLGLAHSGHPLLFPGSRQPITRF